MGELDRHLPYGTFEAQEAVGLWYGARPRRGDAPEVNASGLARMHPGAPLRPYQAVVPDGLDIPSTLLAGGVSPCSRKRSTDNSYSSGDMTFKMAMDRLALAIMDDPSAMVELMARQARRAAGNGWLTRVDRDEVETHAHGFILAAKAFVRTLDPFAFATVTDPSSGVECDVPSWDGLDPMIGRGAPLARAVRACPAHAAILAWSHGTDPDAFPAIDDARDAGALVADALTRHAGLPRRVLRHLAAADAAVAALSPERRHEAGRVMAERQQDGYPTLAAWVLGLLARLPGNWAPGDAAGWDDMVECLPLLAWADERCVDDADMAALVDAGRGWGDLRRRMAGQSGGRAPFNAFEDARDVARALSEELLLPASHLAEGSTEDAVHPGSTSMPMDQAAFSLAYGGLTGVGVLRASARWHAARERRLAAIEGIPLNPSPPSWPASLPEWRHGDVRVTPLTTAAALRAEGASGEDADGAVGLDHCVGGYAGRCRRGESRILSLRVRATDGTWTRLSTAEVAWDGQAVAALQHRGRGNADPPAAALGALSAYLTRVSSDPSTVGEAIRERAAPETDADADAVPVSATCGYAWWVPGHWERVRDAWAPHLPRAFRGASAATFAAAVPTGEVRWGQTWSRRRPSPRGVDAGDAAHAVPGGPPPLA